MEVTQQNHFLEISEEVLKTGNNLRFRALGMSMHPFIRNGEILIVQPVSADELRTGDIAFYKTEADVLVAHRMLTRRANGDILTKGDFGRLPDRPVEKKHILGRVVAVEKSDGRQTNLTKRHYQLIKLPLAKLSVMNISFYRLYRQAKHYALAPARPALNRIQSLKIFRNYARKFTWTVQFGLSTPEDDVLLSHHFGFSSLRRNPRTGKIARSLSEDTDDEFFRLVARKNKKVLGTIAAKRNQQESASPNTWWISGFFVRERYKGRGIGEGLMKHALTEIVKHGNQRAMLFVKKDNTPALSLCKKLGFVQENPAKWPKSDSVHNMAATNFIMSLELRTTLNKPGEGNNVRD